MPLYRVEPSKDSREVNFSSASWRWASIIGEDSVLPLLDDAAVEDASSNIKLGTSSGTVSSVDNVVDDPSALLDRASLYKPECRLKSIVFDLHRVYLGRSFMSKSSLNRTVETRQLIDWILDESGYMYLGVYAMVEG